MSTPHLSPRLPGRPLGLNTLLEQSSAGERLSLTAVTEAVAAVIRASNLGGVADQTLAGRIGALIQPELAQALQGRITSGSELVGQAAFRTILAQHLASANSTQMDEQTRRAMLRTANRTGADFAALVAPHLRGGGWNGRAAADAGDIGGGDIPANGARFDGLSGTDAAFLSSMRDHAIHHGLHWAADRPEILRLGREAIELFARTNFQRESFDRLRAVGFEGRDAVHIARFAERRGLDANHVARETAEGVRAFGNGNRQHEHEWRDRFRNFFANPEDAQARRHLDHGLRGMEEGGTPDQRERARRTRELLKIERQATNELNVERAVENAEVSSTVRREGTATGAQVVARETAQRANDLFAAAPATPTGQPTTNPPPASPPAPTAAPQPAPAQPPASTPAPAAAPSSPVKAAARPAANNLG